MSEPYKIEANAKVLKALQKAGLSEKRQNEPDAEWLAGRFAYDPETGAITGPSGRVLRPVKNERYRTYRIGVWFDGRAVKITAGRVAFAIQHGRWPVGIGYRNGKYADTCAENLYECSSRQLNDALAGRSVDETKGRPRMANYEEQLILEIVASKVRATGRPKKARSRDMLAVLADIRSILEGANKGAVSLSPKERRTLKRAERVISARWDALSRKMAVDPSAALREALAPVKSIEFPEGDGEAVSKAALRRLMAPKKEPTAKAALKAAMRSSAAKKRPTVKAALKVALRSSATKKRTR